MVSKTEAHIHQTWLEYGPSATAAADVRQCLSDLGTEFGIVNSMDVVEQYLDKTVPLPERPAFLYPYAMQVPGILHIIDGAVRAAVQTLSFWPAWQEGSKRILQ